MGTVIDEYILNTPKETQEILFKIRDTIKNNANDAQEKISYGMPGYYLYGPLVYFALNKKHIGFYPTPSGIEHFKEELSEYKTSKGAVQFPLNKPIRYDIIEKIVRFRVAEQIEKNKIKLVK